MFQQLHRRQSDIFILTFIHINKFTYKQNEAGLNQSQNTGVFKVWTGPGSEELRPPGQLTCCPLKHFSPSQNLQKQTGRLYGVINGDGT